MPNHCTNQVTLNCSSEESAKAIKKHLAGKESLFDFNTLIQEPEELQESTKDEATLKELRAFAPKVFARRIPPRDESLTK